MELVTEKYKHTDIGFIPIDWDAKPLKAVFTLKNGYAFSSDYFSETGPIVITPGNFKLEGGLNFNERNTLRYSGDYSTIMKFTNGDLLIVMTDLTPDCNLLGKPGFVNSSETILHNQRIGKIILTNKTVSINYLYWYFLSETFSKRMKSTATGSTVRHTSNGSIYNSLIPIPPTKAEQAAISTALSDTNNYITHLEKLVAKKRLIKQGAMQQLLKPKEGWVVKKLDEIAVFKNGKAHEQFIDENGDYIVINSKFVSTEGAVYKCSNIAYSPLMKGEIAMVMSDIPNGKALAKCFLVTGDDKYTLNQRICSITSDKCDNEFLFRILNRNNYFLAFDTGTGQTNLKRQEVLDCPIPLPPTKEEQTLIASILKDIDEEITILEKKLTKAKGIKQGMMQQLLTGKIRLI